MDRTRPATDHEYYGAELMNILSRDALQYASRAGQRGYVDATTEDGPEDQDDLPDAPEHPAVAEVSDRPPLAVIPEDQDDADVEIDAGSDVFTPGISSIGVGRAPALDTGIIRPLSEDDVSGSRNVRQRTSDTTAAADMRTDDISAPSTPVGIRIGQCRRYRRLRP